VTTHRRESGGEKDEKRQAKGHNRPQQAARTQRSHCRAHTAASEPEMRASYDPWIFAKAFSSSGTHISCPPSQRPNVSEPLERFTGNLSSSIV
jgi:hypothetical protein